jgi:hypothetical protein
MEACSVTTAPEASAFRVSLEVSTRLLVSSVGRH